MIYYEIERVAIGASIKREEKGIFNTQRAADFEERASRRIILSGNGLFEGAFY